MEVASSPLLVTFVAIVALWPIVFLGALALHSWTRRWRRLGQVAFLLPLWMVAASIGLVHVPPFIGALAAPAPTRNLVIAGTASVFALSCAVLAWALLLRSFSGPARRTPDPGAMYRPQAGQGARGSSDART